jgi:hypothetical protein
MRTAGSWLTTLTMLMAALAAGCEVAASSGAVEAPHHCPGVDADAVLCRDD